MGEFEQIPLTEQIQFDECFAGPQGTHFLAKFVRGLLRGKYN